MRSLSEHCSRMTEDLTAAATGNAMGNDRTEPGPLPKLVFVYGETSGLSRRVESYLAQVLQSRGNHDTFDLVRVSFERQPKLVEQLGVSETPTLLVIDGGRIEARVEKPRNRLEIQAGLERWLK
jgi:hypothetical protein